MSTVKQSRAKLEATMNRLIEASVDLSWKGSKPIEEHDGIELEFVKAKIEVKRQLDEVFK